jgi:hypothetical protein
MSAAFRNGCRAEILSLQYTVDGIGRMIRAGDAQGLTNAVLAAGPNCPKR